MKDLSNTRRIFIDASTDESLDILELDSHYDNKETKTTLDTGPKLSSFLRKSG